VSLPRARWEILCILAIHVRSSYVVDYVRLPLGLSTWVDPLTPAPLLQGGEGSVDVQVNRQILRPPRPLGGEGRG